MKKKTLPALLTCLLWLPLLNGGCAMHRDGCKHGACPLPGNQTRTDILYTPSCGTQCSCNQLSVTQHKCACDSAMQWAHVVRIEGNEALICTTKEGCRCAIDPADSAKCGCGMPLTRVNLKETGIYFCPSCNTVASAPGTCNCGKNLRKAE